MIYIFSVVHERKNIHEQQLNDAKINEASQNLCAQESVGQSIEVVQNEEEIY